MTFDMKRLIGRKFDDRSIAFLSAFSQGFEDHTFRDKARNEAHTVLEFAPCQKVPPEKKKVDPRIGTVEQGMF